VAAEEPGSIVIADHLISGDDVTKEREGHRNWYHIHGDRSPPFTIPEVPG